MRDRSGPERGTGEPSSAVSCSGSGPVGSVGLRPRRLKADSANFRETEKLCRSHTVTPRGFCEVVKLFISGITNDA